MSFKPGMRVRKRAGGAGGIVVLSGAEQTIVRSRKNLGPLQPTWVYRTEDLEAQGAASWCDDCSSDAEITLEDETGGLPLCCACAQSLLDEVPELPEPLRQYIQAKLDACKVLH